MIREETPHIVAEVKNVSLSYDTVLVLENVNLRIYQRDFIGLIGPNGGGKSTLLKLMLGLLKPSQGTLTLFGAPPEHTRQLVGYVPQAIHFERDFPITVMQAVLMGRLRQAPSFRPYRKRDIEIAKQVMDQLEVGSLAKRTLRELSGGQLQRVMIARALAGEPKMLALDEPTANIDSRFQQEVHEILRALNETLTIILISHDLGFISSYVNRIICLNRYLLEHPAKPLDMKLLEELYHGPVHQVYHATLCVGDHTH